MSSQYPIDKGWADYDDDYYAGGTEFSMTGGTTYNLPCNAQSGNITQLPEGRTALYQPETLNYDGETGAFTEGLTVTGGTSGATAVITHVEDNGTTGTLYLANVSGTFQNDEAITDSSTGAATVNGTLTEGKITAQEGDVIAYTIEYDAEPQTANTTYVDTWIDIGGAVGELYRRTTSLPKGIGTAVNVTTTTIAYCLDTWESNGGVIKVLANQDITIDNIRVIVFLLQSKK